MDARPNILWLMTDEQRTDSLGCYGSTWALSPHLDQIAREGVLFRHAVTPAPVCQPARAAVLTGQYPSRTGVWYNQNEETPKLNHLVPLFAEAGYHTASFGKNHYDCSPNRAFQFEYNRIIGEEVDWCKYAEKYNMDDYDVVHYPPKPYPWIMGGRFPANMERTVEADVVGAAKRWLSSVPRDEPFLLRLSFNAPHTPVVPPSPFDLLYTSGGITYPTATEETPVGSPKWVSESLSAFSAASRLTAEQIAKARKYYYGETAYADYEFGVMIKWMRKQGYLDNTIIAFVSDHGTHIGDYGLVQKQTFYQPVVQVPFFLWDPQRIRAGVTIETPVETISLLPTLMELAGIAIPSHCDGASLAHTLATGEEPEEKPVFSEFTLGSFDIRHHDRLVMVRHGDWKLSVCLDSGPEDGALFDLAEDPYERHNLYSSTMHQGVVNRLTALIREHTGGAGDEL